MINEKIKHYYLSGDTYQEIADKLNISKITVYRNIKKFGLTHKQKLKKKIRPIKNQITNKRFGNLIVIGRTYNEKYKTWDSICVCDCGRECIRFTSQLLANDSKSCGIKGCKYHDQYHINSGKLNYNFTGYEKISGQLWSTIKCGAKKRNIDFEIDIEYVWNVFLKQNKKCALSGVDIYFSRTSKSERTASLDRINSKKGYVKGNIQWVHKIINIMKRDLSDKDFINWCKLISNCERKIL